MHSHGFPPDRATEAEAGAGAPTEPIELSLIVPMLNEQGNLRLVARRVAQALGAATRYELLFIDDGSSDDSVAVARALAAEDDRVRVLALARNFGKEAAMLAGYDHARGRALVVLDADGQQPPELLPQMLGLWRSGYDVVHAVRTETLALSGRRRVSSRAFYWLLDRMVGVPVVANTADFRLMDHRVVEAVRQCRERHRFNRALVAWAGFAQVCVPYVAAERHSGQTKWSYRGLMRYAMDGVLSFSIRPLRLIGVSGGLLSALSFLYLAFVSVLRIVRPELAGADTGYTSLVGAISLLGGTQLLCVWLLGEYIGRIYEQVKERPPYVLRDLDERQGRRSLPHAASRLHLDAASPAAIPAPHLALPPEPARRVSSDAQRA